MLTIKSNICSEFTPRTITSFLNSSRKYYKPTLDESQMTPKELVENNLLFVVTVSKKYTNKYVPFEDIVQYGCIGLVKASNKFDPTKGFKFISFAVNYIQQQIILGLNEYLDLIKLPFNVKNGFLQLSKINEKYYAKHGEYPSETVLKSMKLVDNRIIDLYLCKSMILNVDNKICPDKEFTFLDVFDGSISSNSWIDDEYFLYKINLLLKKLKPNEEKVIRGLYLENKTRCTLIEELKLGKERIRQIEEKALKKMKKFYIT